MKIGIIREGKNPPDSRVTLTPSQCKELIDKGIDLVVQPSPNRCYSDKEYQDAGIPMSDDLSDRSILIGVKEVPIDQLISDKTYFFFSHTIKEQPYNRGLLQAIIEKNINLIDYEVLTNQSGARVIAFGKFAGMVGAHNGIYTYGKRTQQYSLPRMKDLFDYKEAKASYSDLQLPPMKIVLTGTGRVATGAALVLDDMGVKKVRPIDYVTKEYDYPVYTQLSSFYYAKRKDGKVFDNVQDFYDNPKDYDSDFDHFLPMTDIFINGIYWDNDAPQFFTVEDMKSSRFGIKVVADVTCDIAPVSSIPSTLKASTIADPIFGIDKNTGEETTPHSDGVLDMMTVDNLPNELPRDASSSFGDMFIEYVLDQLFDNESEMIYKGMITKNGDLNAPFEYLRSYINGK